MLKPNDCLHIHIYKFSFFLLYFWKIYKATYSYIVYSINSLLRYITVCLYRVYTLYTNPFFCHVSQLLVYVVVRMYDVGTCTMYIIQYILYLLNVYTYMCKHSFMLVRNFPHIHFFFPFFAEIM